MRSITVVVPVPEQGPGRKPGGRAEMAAALVGAAIWVSSAACTPYGVNTFAPDKLELCPGETTTLRWDVTGPALLKAQRSDSDWDMQVVPSTGDRAFAEPTSTTFTLTAMGQNPAKGNYKTVTVGVATNGPRGGVVTCTSGLCTATLKPDAGGIRVSRLSAPTMTATGRDQPVRICASHAGMAKTCVDADQTVAVDVAFDGPWTLEATVAPDAIPPQKLALSFDFNCLAK